MAAEIKVQVVRKSDEATDIISLELASCNGAPLPPFSAGSHIDVVLPNGQRRQYSLCNDPEETHRYQIAVLREVAGRGGSVAMHALREGDVIAISPPRNHFALSSESGPSLLLAGGIGITPILCMAERLSASSAPFDLHYFSRSAQRTAFRDRILTSPFASSCNFHYDDEPAERKIELEDLLRSSSPEMHLYVCGPAGFMEAVLATARGLGWAETRLHYEFFSAPTDQTHIDEAFQIQLASSGRVLEVPADRSVVDALYDAGIELEVSCEQGVCGTCLTRIIEGVPDHRDVYLTADERARGDKFLPCCSRAKTSLLVLDL